MLNQLFFLVSLSLSADRKFIETSHMSGGVFSWHKALLAQRNLWSKLPLPIKFYKTDVNFTKLVDVIIGDDINFSINAEIKKFIDSANDDESGVESRINYFRSIFPISLRNNINRVIKFDEDGYEGDGGDKDDDWYKTCDKNQFPNVDLLGSIVGSMFPEDLGCDGLNEFIGQVISYGFIIVPLVVMWVIITLFYIFYCCGCCCCCRAKDRYNPSIVSIVFYAIIASLLIIALIFNIVASVYLLNILNYVLQGEVFKDIDFSLGSTEAFLKPLANSFQKEVTKSIDTAAFDIENTVDSLFEEIDNLVNAAKNNFSKLNDIFEDVKDINKTNIQPSLDAQDKFPQCNSSYNEVEVEEDRKKICAQIVEEINKSFGNFDIEPVTKIIDSMQDINESINHVGDITSELDELKKFKEQALDYADKAREKIVELNLSRKVDDLNLSKLNTTLEDYEVGIPYKKYHPIPKAACFLFPVFMFILTALEIMAFWLKNCCSRCIVCYCCPRCVCTCCLFFVGLFCTLAAIALIIIDLIYDQGDETIDYFIKKFLNDDRKLVFGEIKVPGGGANGMIDDFYIDDFQIKKPQLIKSFVDAKLGTKLTDYFQIFTVFDFSEIGDIIENSVTKLYVNTSIITDMVKQYIEDTKQYIDVDLSNSLQLEIVNGTLNNLEAYEGQISDACPHTSCESEYKTAVSEFTFLLGNITKIADDSGTALSQVKAVIDDIPDNIKATVDKLVKQLLDSVGGQLSNILRSIPSSLEEGDVDFAISLFNIVRVKACKQLLGSAMAFSISAHLFIVGYAAMTILLCCRRKGMGKVARDQSVYSYSYSYSGYSYSKNETKNKKKKPKGRQISDDENTSGNGLEDIDDNNPASDAEKRDLSVSDEQSNYVNPYMHDDSSTIHDNSDQNEFNDEIESSFFQSESTKPKVSEVESGNENESSILEESKGLSFNDEISKNESTTTNENESERQPAKISENDDDETSNNNNNATDNSSTGNNSDGDDDDQQTYVY